MSVPIQTIEKVGKSDCFAIYGAQVVAYGAFAALRELCGAVPECFIVSTAEGNPAEIEGISVCVLDECGLRSDTLILVAVTEFLHGEICVSLENGGFCNYLCIDAHEEHLLMSAYFGSIGRFPLLEGCKTTGTSLDFAVYEAKNHRDKPLSNPPVLMPWERTIQAGADITDMRVAALLDNTGENISAKNMMYSEMTATYWVWKNTAHDWKGICHYRRHLVLSDGQIAELAEGGVDAVLPLPYVCFPNTRSQFGRFVSRAVIDVLLGSFKALHPDCFEKYLSILNGQYQYTYNLVAARRDVFDDYCAWTFEVLEHMERSASVVPEICGTRALSYAAEVLTSLYFLSNAKRLNIKHIEKRICV